MKNKTQNLLVVSFVGIRIVPIQFVVNDILTGMRWFGPLQSGARLVDICGSKVARLRRNSYCETFLGMKMILVVIIKTKIINEIK